MLPSGVVVPGSVAMRPNSLTVYMHDRDYGFQWHVPTAALASYLPHSLLTCRIRFLPVAFASYLPHSLLTCRIRFLPVAARIKKLLDVRRRQVHWPAQRSFKMKCSVSKLAPPCRHEVLQRWPSHLVRRQRVPRAICLKLEFPSHSWFAKQG